MKQPAAKLLHVQTFAVAAAFFLWQTQGATTMPVRAYGQAAEWLPAWFWACWVIVASTAVVCGYWRDSELLRAAGIFVHLVSMAALAWFCLGASMIYPVAPWTFALVVALVYFLHEEISEWNYAE